MVRVFYEFHTLHEQQKLMSTSWLIYICHGEKGPLTNRIYKTSCGKVDKYSVLAIIGIRVSRSEAQ